ncbi:MAG: FAD-dependent oxidoreductase [Chitinophagaceae bacterium]|nr:FAD-dependent oxidoreductase [Chitinophagaceae bacterium]
MKRILTLKTALFICLASLIGSSATAQEKKTIEADICVYGGTSAGIIAAYTAKMYGKSVIVVEPGGHIGGLTSGGLGQTDIGNKYAVTGIALDFYRKVGQHYGKFEQWIFEPSVTRKLYEDYIKKANLRVLTHNRIVSATKSNGVIRTITIEDALSPASANTIISAKMFIDCSYEGDLMAKAGVSYTTGREPNSLYNETLNGVQMAQNRYHQFPNGVDPYKIKGDPSSGLLWGISDKPAEPDGSGDKKIQAYNFRLCLTDSAENRIAITRPDGYDASRYELLLRLMEAKPWTSVKNGFIWSMMPNRKTDINNYGAFSTDMIGENYEYPEASYEQRAAIIKRHVEYTKGLLYFLGNDLRVPLAIRNEMQEWGYPKDEYPDNGHFSPQPYIREARRMVGEYVMTQNNCQGREIVSDGIGMAAYTMDSHHTQRLVDNGMVKNEGDVQVGGFDPYPISYRSIIPKAADAKNIYVPVCLSASHIAFGSIRMEPVFMVLAQSAAVAASMAIDENKSVHEVDVKKLQAALASNPYADGRAPEIVVDNEDKKNVRITGDWKTLGRNGFGPTLLVDSNASGAVKTVRFTPPIAQQGEYELYTYYPKLNNNASQTKLIIFDGKKKIEKTIRSAEVLVLGQTTGVWHSLGVFQFPKGKKAYVEISNKDADGAIIADAILLSPVKDSAKK